MRDPRRVLIAWIALAQLLAFPFVAFAAMMGLVAVPLRLASWAPILMIVGVSVVFEAGAASFCAERLRGRLADRLRFSPHVVAFTSSLGLLAGTLLAVGLMKAWSMVDIPLEPLMLIPIGIACLVLGSALGTLLGCRYRPG